MHEKSNIIVSSIWYETKVMDRILIPKEEKNNILVEKKNWKCLRCLKKESPIYTKKKTRPKIPGQKNKQANDSS